MYVQKWHTLISYNTDRVCVCVYHTTVLGYVHTQNHKWEGIDPSSLECYLLITIIFVLLDIDG